MPPLARALLTSALLFSLGPTAAAPARFALVTMLEGDAAMLRDGDRLALAEGVALKPGDLISTGPEAHLLRVEYADGLSVAFGPGSRVQLAPRAAGEGAGAGDAVYLLAGWAKLSAPKSVAASLQSPALDADVAGATAVLAVQASGTQVFAESGELRLRSRAKAVAVPPALKAGELLGLPAGGGKPEASSRPTPAFVQAMPRAFMDALPPLAARFQGRADAVPKKAGPLVYADAQPWLDGEPAVRRAAVKRWRGLARDPDFRAALVAGLKSHPEWQPVLFPPEAVSAPAAKAAPAPAYLPAPVPVSTARTAPATIPAPLPAAPVPASAPPPAPLRRTSPHP